MKGWRFVILEQNPETGEKILTAKGQILAPIGNTHWLVQFYGEKSAFCKTLSAEALEALTLFPNDQQLNGFLAEQFPPAPPTPEELKALEAAKSLADALKASTANGEDTPEGANDDDQLHAADDDGMAIAAADPEPLVVVPEVPDKPEKVEPAESGEKPYANPDELLDKDLPPAG